MAQNEMRAMRGMPLRVRSMEGLGPAVLKAGCTLSDFVNILNVGCTGLMKPARLETIGTKPE